MDEVVDRLIDEHPPTSTDEQEFLAAQFDAGLAWVHFDEGCGGLGIAPGHQQHAQARLTEAGAPHPYPRNPIGYGMGGPTVFSHGSKAQQHRYLRPLFTGEEIWCQMFSEPGAGSDIASLATSAARDGEEWVINGQKVWTTLAHVARFGLLATRSDPLQPKHKGMTCFVVDMTVEGIDVRPLRQMTGEAEFNHVYLTDVRVPDSERLGDVNEGWRVVLTTLMNERVSIGDSVPPRGAGLIERVVELWEKLRMDDPVRRDELTRLWIRAEVARLTNARAAEARRSGIPGPEGSIGKLAMAELNQDIGSLWVDLLGAAGSLYGSYEMTRPAVAMEFVYAQQAFLRVQANSIEGGTSNVLRNILAERVLGLPGDIRADRDRAWRDVPRG